jgi:NAD(P)H-dependent flavin oxidoreductase YrpB (nitropropane dioxygenase family)
MMKVLVATTLAAGLVFAAGGAFAQTPASTPATPTLPGAQVNPGGGGSAAKAERHAEYQKQWEDCMRQQEAKYGGVKTVGPHAGANNKGNWKANSKGKPLPPDEKADAKKGVKENRHQAEMDDCREQLYGRDTPEPGHK